MEQREATQALVQRLRGVDCGFQVVGLGDLVQGAAHRGEPGFCLAACDSFHVVVGMAPVCRLNCWIGGGFDG